MLKYILVYGLLLVTSALAAQNTLVLSDSDVQQVTDYAILPDKGYHIDRIAGDTTLLFVESDSLRPGNQYVWWLRMIVTNRGPYSMACHLRVVPQLFNTLYYRHAGTGKWVEEEGGVYSPPDGSIYKNDLPFLLRGEGTDTLYVRVSLANLVPVPFAVKPLLMIAKKDMVAEKENQIFTIWFVGFVLLLLFSLNYLYVYRTLREKIIFYFLVAQSGGILYITSYWYTLYKWFPAKVFTSSMTADGLIQTYNTNALLMHLSVVLILYGLVQMTRHFLVTAVRLPELDRILKFSLRLYLLFAFVLAFINIFIKQVNHITLSYDNVFCLLIILAIAFTSFVGFVRGFPAARPFLFANMVPLVFMTGTAVLHVFTEINTTGDWLPLLAIVAQSLGYSIAVVAFIRDLRQNFEQKKQEAQQLALEIQEMDFRHRLITLENREINLDILQEKKKNELLQRTLEYNQRELASNALYMVQKNELLAKLKTEISELTRQHPHIEKKEFSGVSSLLNSHVYLDAEWEKFKIHFEQVHPRFFEDLQERYPTLTRNEARLYAYFHINLSNKEVARLLNIDPASVRQAKMRLHKKLAVLNEE